MSKGSRSRILLPFCCVDIEDPRHPTAANGSSGQGQCSCLKGTDFCIKPCQCEVFKFPTPVVTEVYAGMKCWCSLLQQSASFETEVSVIAN